MQLFQVQCISTVRVFTLHDCLQNLLYTWNCSVYPPCITWEVYQKYPSRHLNGLLLYKMHEYWGAEWDTSWEHMLIICSDYL